MIPDFQAVMLPLLKNLSDEQTHHVRDLVEQIAKEFNLTEQERSELLPGGTQEIINNRVGWAASYLKKAQLIQSSKRGYFQITSNGKKLLNQNITVLDVKLLKTIPEFLNWHNSSKTKKTTAINIPDASLAENKTPEELFEESFNLLREELVSELIDQIKNCTPRFFEHLVVDLLIKMGYGGSRSEAGQIIGKSGDGGIDGIINEDKLGLDTIYIQAKKWDKTVPVSQIRDFAGALLSKKAKKGIFITTSNFPQSAYDFVNSIEPRIILIDGIQLANYMIEANLGVSIKRIYEIKKIDTDYFEGN